MEQQKKGLRNNKERMERINRGGMQRNNKRMATMKELRENQQMNLGSKCNGGIRMLKEVCFACKLPKFAQFGGISILLKC